MPFKLYHNSITYFFSFFLSLWGKGGCSPLVMLLVERQKLLVVLLDDQQESGLQTLESLM